MSRSRQRSDRVAVERPGRPPDRVGSRSHRPRGNRWPGDRSIRIVAVAVLGVLVSVVSPATAGSDESLAIVDASGRPGEYSSSLVLDADGNPVVSYYDSVDRELRLAHCNDPNCTGGDESVQVVAPAGDPDGWDTALALDVEGHPVISYYDASLMDVRLVHCNDSNCAGDDESLQTVHSAGAVSESISLALDGAGNPMISYFSEGLLRLARCNDPNCAGDDESLQIVDPTVDLLGWDTSLVLDADDHPVIAYHHAMPNQLRLAHCNDPNCAGGDDPLETVANAGLGVQYMSVALDADGHPVIGYQDTTDFTLRLAHCNDPNCAGGDESLQVVGADSSGYHTSLVLDAAGNPVVSHAHGATSSLRLTHCNDPNCTGGDESVQAIDSLGWIHSSVPVVLDAAGNPVIGYHDVEHRLRLAHCNDPNCTDLSPPTATIDLAADQAALVDTGPVSFSVVFDEAVTGFDTADVVIGGTAGATTGVVSGTGSEYTVTIDAIPGDGTVTVDLRVAAVIDANGNPSTAATVLANSVTIASVAPTTTTAAPIPAAPPLGGLPETGAGARGAVLAVALVLTGTMLTAVARRGTR